MKKINYTVDFIEVKRWVEGDNALFLVDRLEQEKDGGKIGPVTGIEDYDEEFYKRNYNKQSATQFLKYAKGLEKLVKEQGWDLEMKYNKHYCGFKAGFFNAFGIHWIGTKTFAFFFKIPEEEAKQVQIEMTRYDSQWKQAMYYIEPGQTKTKDYLPLFERAYARLTGA